MDLTERREAAKGTARFLSEMTWPEVERAVEGGVRTVILPLGATEQHGPHLPLATDTIRAEALAARIAARLAQRLSGALVAPVLPFGCSDEHSGFAGLLGLEAGTLAAVISDVARRVSGWGVRRLVVLSAHGGNDRALREAAERLEHEVPELSVWLPEDLTAVAAPVSEVADREGISADTLGIHAGESETSEMLHLRPELVRRERAEPGFTGDMEAVVERLYAGGLKPVTESGVLGDPTRAEAGRGERYLDALAEEIAARVLSEEDGE